MSPRLDGFDVSHYQGPAFPWDWSRAQGHTLAGFKVIEGGHLDPTEPRNRATTAALGFRYRAGYIFELHPGEPIDQQVAELADVLGPLQLGEFIQIDAEAAGLTVDDMVAAWAAVQARYPFRAIMYGGNFFNGWTHDPRLAGIPWWLAWYGPQSFDEIAGRLPWQPTIWQWGGGKEGAVVPGVVADGGRCDSNQIIRVDVLEALCGYAASPPPAVIPPASTTNSAALAALTEDTMLRFVKAATPAPGVDPLTTWVTNGMVRTVPTEQSAAYAIAHGLAGNTLATADVLSDDELRGLPLVGA